MNIFKWLFRLFTKRKATNLDSNTQTNQPNHQRFSGQQVVIPHAEKETLHKQPTQKRETVIIDSQTGDLVQDTKSQSDNLALEKARGSLPPNTPDDIVHLTLINKAFREGIEAIKRLNLDEDLFQQAIADLYKKYQKERSKYSEKKM